jgi:hypothetical protein
MPRLRCSSTIAIGRRRGFTQRHALELARNVIEHFYSCWCGLLMWDAGHRACGVDISPAPSLN